MHTSAGLEYLQITDLENFTMIAMVKSPQYYKTQLCTVSLNFDISGWGKLRVDPWHQC